MLYEHLYNRELGWPRAETMPSKVTFSSLVQGRTIPSIHLTTEEFLELHADIERFCLHKIAQKSFHTSAYMIQLSQNDRLSPSKQDKRNIV